MPSQRRPATASKNFCQNSEPMKSPREKAAAGKLGKSTRYLGLLGQPIVANHIPGLLADDARHIESARQVGLMLEKLPLLAEAHGVANGDWFALVLALAREHVPGFKVVAKGGRSELWSDIEKAELSIEVEAARKALKTLKQAIEAVLLGGRWAEKRPTASALETHYRHADKKVVALLRDAQAYRTGRGDR